MQHRSTVTWNSLPVDWRPKIGEVHIWQAPTDQFLPMFDLLYELLTPEEANRADRFHFDKDRHLFVVGRATLRAVVGYLLSKAPKEVRIVTNDTGKPFLSTGELHFNLSHSANIVLLALCLEHPVGVDVERIKPIA